MLWSHSGGIRPQFAWKVESQGVSQVVAGSVGSLELPRGPEGASHVVSGKSGILLNCEGPLGIPLELVHGTRVEFKYIERGQQKNLLSQMQLPLSKPLLRPTVSFLITRIAKNRMQGTSEPQSHGSL